jgi:hypothetical protein
MIIKQSWLPAQFGIPVTNQSISLVILTAVQPPFV